MFDGCRRMTEYCVHWIRSLACIWKQYKRNTQKWNDCNTHAHGYDAYVAWHVMLSAHRGIGTSRAKPQRNYIFDGQNRARKFFSNIYHSLEEKKRTWGQRASISHVETRKNVMISLLLFECVKWNAMWKKGTELLETRIFYGFSPSRIITIALVVPSHFTAADASSIHDIFCEYIIQTIRNDSWLINALRYRKRGEAETPTRIHYDCYYFPFWVCGDCWPKRDFEKVNSSRSGINFVRYRCVPPG